ncbi:MAG: PLP-dependent aminotransferase family protein [Chloroflexota bacterium]|nr:PLP-dependent aminotransferase family protein [Chloroflexota bacterium]
MGTFWDDHLAQGAQHLTSSAIRDLLKVTEQPEMISLAGGLPAPECFPTAALAAAAAHVLAHTPTAALQYGPTEGYRPLRALLAEWMTALQVPVTDEEVLMTSGSQQALDLLGKLLIDPGAPVAVEEPTYVGALQAWRPYRPRFITLPTDAAGLCVDALADVLARGERPRFVYLVSSFQNPTGTTLTPARRHALLELAGRYRLPIIEDDPYGELYYDGARVPLLAAQDRALHGRLRHVIYLSTFSKLLAPGLRVGWVVAPTPLLRRIVHAKQGMDLHTGSLTQATIYEACRDGLLDRHVPALRATYRARRDALLGALQRQMPAEVQWTRPDGGMFVWLTLPGAIDATRLLAAALAQQVAFVPGAAFHALGGGHQTLRLNFSHTPPAQMETGIGRLAQALGVVRGEPPVADPAGPAAPAASLDRGHR